MIYLHLSLSQRLFDRSMLTKRCRCFNHDTKGADGAPDLLQALSHSPLLEELNFSHCFKIPAAAWQKVRSAKWLNLKKADFRRCLAERNVWMFYCFLRVSVGSCSNPEAWWDLWSCRISWSWPAEWYTCTCPCLTVFSTDRCWQNTAGASSETRKEQMDPQICLEHWVSHPCWRSWILDNVSSPQQPGKKSVVPSGSTWRQISPGASQREMVEVEGSLVLCAVHVSLLEVDRLQEHGEICQVVVWVGVDLYGFKNGLRWIFYLHLSLSQRVFDRSMLRKHCRCFSGDTQEADGAADLLEALIQATQLEELIFGYNQIPTGAWQKVRSAKWLNLKKADFTWCLANGWGFSCFLRRELSLLEVVLICEVIVWVILLMDGILHHQLYAYTRVVVVPPVNPYISRLA